MNKYIVFLICALCGCLLSCQKEEGGDFSGNTGGVRLQLPALDNETDIPVIMTRGAFGMDPNTFCIVFYRKDANEEGYTECGRFDTYAAMIEKGMPLVLPIGNYKVKACSFEAKSGASRIPYFEGETTFVVEEKTVTDISVHCTFKSLGVELKLSDRFAALLQNEPDNYSYSVSVSNGSDIQLFNSENEEPVYFMAGCDNLVVKVTVKLDAQNYPERTYRLTNNGVSPRIGEYYIITLDAGEEELKLTSKKMGE